MSFSNKFEAKYFETFKREVYFVSLSEFKHNKFLIRTLVSKEIFGHLSRIFNRQLASYVSFN